VTGEKRSPSEPHGRRRSTGGARREASDRAILRAGGGEVSGWTLNLSRGGVRLVIEEPVLPGTEYEVHIADEAPRRGRVVWVQTEADGQIVGVQFLDAAGRPLPGELDGPEPTPGTPGRTPGEI
jgi:hypothetical protein